MKRTQFAKVCRHLGTAGKVYLHVSLWKLVETVQYERFKGNKKYKKRASEQKGAGRKKGWGAGGGGGGWTGFQEVLIMYCHSNRQSISQEQICCNCFTACHTGSNLLWASSRGDFFPWSELGFWLHSPQTLLDESINQGLVSAHMHSIAQTQKILTLMSLTGEHWQQKRTPSMHHPRRRNVTTCMVGLENGHIRKNLTENGEPLRSGWERRRSNWGNANFPPIGPMTVFQL